MATIFDESIFYKSCQLKKGGSTDQQIMEIMFPLIAQKIDKMVGVANSQLPSNYQAAERSFTKKMNKLVVSGIISDLFDHNNSQNKEQNFAKLFAVVKSLSVDEIKAGQVKLRK